MSDMDENFARLAGLEPLYKARVSPRIDKLKAAEAARLEMERRQKTREHQSILDDHMKVMAGIQEPQTAGMKDVGEATSYSGKHPASALEAKASARYELVVGSKLKRTLKNPKAAVKLAKKMKGSVQVVDSQSGDVLYDSEA